MTTKEKIEIMQAYLEGKTIQYKDFRKYPFVWTDIEGHEPAWSWCDTDYRVASKSPIASGYNPRLLTEDQVGVADGWRLLHENEIGCFKHKFPVFRYWKDEGKWGEETANAYSMGWCYRTKAPIGGLKVEVKTVPLSVDDLPAVCWLRWKGEEGNFYLVTRVSTRGVFCQVNNGASIPFEYLLDKCEYSSDRKTWLPCSKQVEV